MPSRINLHTGKKELFGRASPIRTAVPVLWRLLQLDPDQAHEFRFWIPSPELTSFSGTKQFAICGRFAEIRAGGQSASAAAHLEPGVRRARSVFHCMT
jgi:hypothetical protein